MRAYIKNCIINLTLNLLFKRNKALTYSKIIVHRVGTIGDTVASLPAIYHLKKSLPNSKIYVLYCHDGFSFNHTSELTNKYIDGYFSYSILNKNLINYFNLFKILRRHKFDLWLSLPQDLTNFRTEIRNIFFAKSILAKNAYGFSINIDNFSKKYLRHSSFENEKIRLVNIVKKIINKQKINKLPICKYLDLNKIKNKDLNKKIFNIKNQRILVLCIGSNRKPNKWSLNNYKFIIQKWIEKDCFCIVIGGKSEIDESIILSRGFSSTNFLNLTGKLTINESVYILSKAYLVLGNDTGMMHFADLLNKNIISIFSSRDFKGKWYPATENSKVFRPLIECSCFLKNYCENKCINLINKKDVWRYMDEFYLNNLESNL